MDKKRYLNNQILLSLVALLVVLVLSVSITYSWIEGGTTYSMQTENVGDVKTESDPKNDDYNGTIKLNPKSTQEINLFEYDSTTNDYQDIFFSPVSSADGKKFFFPINMSGESEMYRVSNTNDIGTKFVNFNFDVESLKKCYLAFNGEPTITATKGGSDAGIDTSAFRIMLSDGTTKGTYIFSPAKSAQTNPAVTSVSGTTATKGTLTTKTYTNYLYSSDKAKRLYSYDKGAKGNIEVSIWLDSGADVSTLLGSDISISLNLVVAADDIDATFNAVTFDRSGTKVSNGFTGGSIKYGSTTYAKSFTVSGTSFTASAVANEGYKFKGWFTDAACTKSVSTATTMPSQTPDDDITYYAKFQEISVTKIYIEERDGFSAYDVYAYHKSGSTTTHYSADWPGSDAEFDGDDTGYYLYEFETTDVGEFNVIISDNGADQYPATNVEGLVGTLGKTYLFTADNKLIEFDPADMITFKTVSNNSSYGNALVNGRASVKIRSGDSVALTASAVSGYKFVGWYKNSACSTTIGSNYTTANQTVKITGTEGSTITYYAKFEKIPVVTVKTSVTPSGGGTATVNSGSSASVQTGKSVTLKATAASGYVFDGWYTNSGCTTNIGSNYMSTSASYKVTSTTDGATVTIYAKFAKLYAVKAYAVTDGTSSSSTGGTVQIDSGAAGATATSNIKSGSSVTLTATVKSGYKFQGWYTAASGGTLKSSSTSYTISSVTAATNLYARFVKDAKTLDVGVIYYLMDNSNVTQVYYWCDSSPSATIDLTNLTATEENYSFGSGYWNGAAQKFYCYNIEVPDDVTGIKFRNGNNWFGGDVKSFEDGKIDLIFEYGGSYINYRTTK